MDGTKLTEGQRTTIRLERCMRDFKAYGKERRAYVRRLLDQISSDGPGRLTSRRPANMESALAREAVSLRKGNGTLSSRNKFPEKENNEPYNLLKNRP